MRPRAIVWFELLMIATILLGLGDAALSWNGLVAQFRALSGDPQGVAALVVLLTFGLVLLLTLLASRRRNGAALLLLLLLFLGGLPQIAHQLVATGVRGTSPLTLLGLAGQAGAFALAATGPARRWFSGRGRSEDVPAPVDPLGS